MRYSALVMTGESGCGLIVIVTVRGCDTRPNELVAVMLSVVTTSGPGGMVGAVNLTVALVAEDGLVTATPVSVVVGATLKVSGTRAGVLGSAPVTVKSPLAPENTDSACTGLTVGATAGLTNTVVVTVEVPAAFVTFSVNVTVVGTATTGALYTGAATLSWVMLPEAAGSAVHAKVNGAVPVALPASVMDAPELTVYGPP